MNIYCDGSYVFHNKTSGVAIVNDDGELLDDAAYIGFDSSLTTELYAIYKCFEYCDKNNIVDIVIFNDCVRAVSSVNWLLTKQMKLINKKMDKQQLDLLNNINLLLYRFHNVKVLKGKDRNGNSIHKAHYFSNAIRKRVYHD